MNNENMIEFENKEIYRKEENKMYVKVDTACYRTIEQCFNLIKQIDPDTAITSFYIRELVKKVLNPNENQDEEINIVVRKTGNKALIQLCSLFDFLSIKLVDYNKVAVNA